MDYFAGEASQEDRILRPFGQSISYAAEATGIPRMQRRSSPCAVEDHESRCVESPHSKSHEHDAVLRIARHLPGYRGSTASPWRKMFLITVTEVSNQHSKSRDRTQDHGGFLDKQEFLGNPDSGPLW